MDYKFSILLKNICDVETKMSKVTDYSIADIITFNQTWQNTGLGFNPVFSGQAITDAYTTVVKTMTIKSGVYKYYVFFNGRFAYSVENATDAFLKDLDKRELKDCDTAKQYY